MPVRHLFIAAGVAAATLVVAGAVRGAPPAGPVVELRQYKIVAGRRDAMVALFDREFVESQEALGMRLVGQFRDLDDPHRFTWIREFPGMAERERALTAFYGGSVWRAHRGAANPMLEDNDNVLLLRPAGPGRGFGASPARGAPTPAGVLVAHVWSLWKEPDAAFVEAFDTVIGPELAAAGVTPVAAYLPERAANTFPRLPVREGEKVFVWFARASSEEDYAQASARLQERPAWRAFLADRLEREPQVLRLAPTPRSAWR